jgi:ABC-type glycerol-3-phosphate transport system substrate-binding protein
MISLHCLKGSDMTRIRRFCMMIGLTIAAVTVLASCSSSNSSTSTTGGNSTPGATAAGGATSTTLTPSAEYLLLVAPVDRAKAAFKASKTGSEATASAGPFATALTTWSSGLSSYPWTSTVEPDVRALVAAIPAEVADLNKIADGDVDDIPSAASDGAPLDSAALKVRSDLGLPETTS